MKRTMIMGDIHGSWGRPNILINKKLDEIERILQCGDFGYWPNFHGKTSITSYGARYTFDNYGLKNKNIPVYFCDGNHENHPSLLEGDKVLEDKNIHYMKRGNVLALEDGRIVLFMGGAKSIDRRFRTAGWDWFDGESISEKDLYNLPDTRVDIVISHTCPKEFNLFGDKTDEHFTDDNRGRLSFVLNKYKPNLWFFGHFHTYKEGWDSKNECRWTALSECNDSERWWTWLT